MPGMNRWDDWSARLIAFVTEPTTGFGIALILPVVLVSVFAKGPAQVLVLVVIYLIEAVGYAVYRRRNSGIASRPGPVLQVGYGCLGALLILAGLFVASSASGPSVLFGWALVVIGAASVGWMGRRVARGSGDSLGGLIADEGTILWRALPPLLVGLLTLAVMAGVSRCAGGA